MSNKLSSIKVAILASEGFEEIELAEPRKALEGAGASTYLISPEKKSIRAWDHDHWSDEYDVDVLLENADPSDYDALLIPGGVLNPDQLRTYDKAKEFATYFLQSGKPVASICHGPQLLIETGMLKDRKITSYHSIKTDLKNAGAQWVDQEVVTDDGLTTSRNPNDLPAFNNRIIDEFSKVQAHV
jgi:protease I